jgi:hypothetical protein
MREIRHFLFVNVLLVACLIFGLTLRASSFSRYPILVLATNKYFGFFTAGILKTEGFNEFRMDSISDSKISTDYLKNFDIVILTEMLLTEMQRKILRGYVSGGGCLIAFKPDSKLSDVFGISESGGTIDGGYISIDTSTEIGKGMIPWPLQFHGLAGRYLLAGGKKIVSFYEDSGRSTSPAVVLNEYGKGHSMAFLYNPAQSIVLTRQGNYLDAGEEMDGIPGIRAMDMFTRGWVDTTKNILNQADEQMRLFSHGIEKMAGYSKPLPRFWYFPDTLKCVVTLTNDGEDSKQADFEPQFEDVKAKGAKMTLYVKEMDSISSAWITEWINRGFEISGHPDDTKQATAPDWKTMDNVYQVLINRLKKQYGISGMYTVTNHWFVWCGKNAVGERDFAAQARIEEKNGIKLDCNYAHYDNNSSYGHFLGPMGTDQGNYTGSGLIMKFMDENGKPINVFQQLNNVYDQQYMEHHDQEGFYNCFKGLMDRSLNSEVYSFISIKAHNNEYYFSKIPLMKMLDYSNSMGVPVWSGRKLLDFLNAKDKASFTNINWSANKLSFTINTPLNFSSGLTYLIPYRLEGKKIFKIMENGLLKTYLIRIIKGSEYAMVKINPGFKNNVEVNYSIASDENKSYLDKRPNTQPEPKGWYVGDIHVHRNCGDGTNVFDESKLQSMMEPNHLSVISLLADMGNGEVKYSKVDLQKVTGKNAPESKPTHIIHWDAEWHWDATYSNFSHQALGGHLVILGLKKAHQIWSESPYKVLEWAKLQHAVRGFAHMEYLKDSFQNELNCCIPVEYPVEAALGTIDFISEDVYGSFSHNNGNYNSEAAIQAYYKLLNCGFRPGFAAGTDFPCNELEPLGTLLTYVKIKDKVFTYDKWIAGIKDGRTVISRNGHNEFIELKADKVFEPGDEINIKNKKLIALSVKWTGTKELAGKIELVCNGKVIAGQSARIIPGSPFLFRTTLEVATSSWICARRMDEHGHEAHTAPIYVIVNKKQVRASAEDAAYFISWIDQLLLKTSPGGTWDHYFTHDLETVQARYLRAKSIYYKIMEEAKKVNN